MFIHIIDVHQGTQQQPIKLNHGKTTIGIDRKNLEQSFGIIKHRSKYPLTISFDKYNIMVINQGSSLLVEIDGHRLMLNTPFVWQEGQELRLQGEDSEFLLYREQVKQAVQSGTVQSSTRHSLPAINVANLRRLGSWRTWLSTLINVRLLSIMQGFSTILALMAIGFITSLFILLGSRVSPDYSSAEGSLPTPPPLHQGTPNPVQVTSTMTPTIVFVKNRQDRFQSSSGIGLSGLSNQKNATQQESSTPTPTPTPVPCTQLPIHEIQGLTTELVQVTNTQTRTIHLWPVESGQPEVELMPPCVVAGTEYWHLSEARHIPLEESGGRHHLYVDAVNPNKSRAHGIVMVMNWADGDCRRHIRDVQEPFEHGEHCPMYASAPAYELFLEENIDQSVPSALLPSDRISGLGLATDDHGNGLLTSLYFRFDKRKYLPNP